MSPYDIESRAILGPLVGLPALGELSKVVVINQVLVTDRPRAVTVGVTGDPVVAGREK